MPIWPDVLVVINGAGPVSPNSATSYEAPVPEAGGKSGSSPEVKIVTGVPFD